MAEVSVNIQQKPEICATVTTECGLKVLGVFTPNQKESKIALMKAFCNQQQGKSDEMLKKEFDAGKLTGLSFKAYIKFNSTTLTASIDLNSIQYPIRWSKEKEVNNEIVNNTVNSQAVNNQAVNNQTVNNQTVNNQAVNNQTVNNQAVNKSIIKQSIIRQSIIKQSIIKQSIVKQSIIKQSIIRQSIVKQSIIRQSIVKYQTIKH
ncbi:MAG: hypothetical protein JGK31_25245 [Microcoleus sp. PH2017_30_WIL_O_A]|nr:hypothetical protein [Microcoleus sp. PH2017_30_WIL_O_A]